MGSGEASAEAQELQAAVRETARKDIVRFGSERGLTLTPEAAADPDVISRLLANVTPDELQHLPHHDQAFIESLGKLEKPVRTLVEVMLRSAALRLTKPPQGKRDPMYPDGTYRTSYPGYVRLLSLIPKALGEPSGMDMGLLEQHVRRHVQLTGNVTSNPHPKMVDARPFTY